MQIDFHHGVTYVLARMAGFSHHDADIIAKSSQFVDDSICDIAVRFTNAAIYKPVLSAHRALNYQNFDELGNYFVWVPFHFLPGNCLKKADEIKGEEFFERIICKPNSYIAQDMIKECIERKDDPNALYRLGITMHVYADTWAHQGFSGIKHKSNSVSYFCDDKELILRVGDFFSKTGFLSTVLKFTSQFSSFDKLSIFITDHLINGVVRTVLPLGHGAVLSYPDKPYLSWRYIDYSGKEVPRDNSAFFIDAAENMYKALQRYIIGDPDADVQGFSKDEAEFFKKKFLEINDDDGDARHKKWIEMIENGILNIEPIKISYNRTGWIQETFHCEKIDTDDEYEYFADFEDSNWRKFNDAIKEHSHYLYLDLFPKYGLCIA